MNKVKPTIIVDFGRERYFVSLLRIIQDDEWGKLSESDQADGQSHRASHVGLY